ncbi:MAG TPA: capsule assembly Wzi family protein, partial [Flavobacteriaceae bacterium]|nr:capsule assembly Wzi family protein [Flavobacteriaceae bacterium]
MRFIQICIYFCALSLFAQQPNKLGFETKISSYISSEEELPFWFTASDYGTVPNQNNGLAYFSLYSEKEVNPSKLSFNYKIATTGFVTENKNDVFINELYGSFHYKNWELIIGSQNDKMVLEGLSSSNGNIVKSINARAYPGIKLQTNGYLKLPFAKKWLSVSGYYADYILNDKRVIDNTKLHTKRLYFKSKLSEKLDLITGLTHYAQWGGTSPEYGKQPQTFKDYLRVVTGSSGDANATIGDQMNALGNQLGSYRLALHYNGLNTNWKFYYSHLFEDASGREMQNWRDGLYGLFIDFKQPQSLVSHVLTEFTHTKHMSGSNAPDDADGGR